MKKKVNLTPEQKAELKEKKEKDRQDRKFLKDIDSIFSLAGFTPFKTEGKKFYLGGRDHEIDHCFIYQNVIVLCERTLTNKEHIREHITKKQQSIEIILKNKKEFLEVFFRDVLGKAGGDRGYTLQRWVIKYCYFAKEKKAFKESDKGLFKPIQIVDDHTFLYFKSITSCLKKSSIYELFNYLGIKNEDVGESSPRSTSDNFEVTIIHPEENTGLTNGVKVVSFMISPDDLIKNGYVLRKENWEEKIDLYQRMVTKSRLLNIRKDIIKNRYTFFNNVILSLPKNVSFKDENGPVALDSLENNKSYTMTITESFNSIGIIDGQHRIYSFYQNDVENPEELEIKELRKRFNLLATGLIFPPDWTPEKRRDFESDIFLDINKNPRKVKSSLIMSIGMSKDRFNDYSIARDVIIKLNDEGPLAGLFEISALEKAPLKMTSIIKYAMKSLVSPSAPESLFHYWNPTMSVETFRSNPSNESEYALFCSSIIGQYFSAIKANYRQEWIDKTSTILKVVSINGFLICLRLSLATTSGPKNFEFYKTIFAKKHFSFVKGTFKYSGSLYYQFGDHLKKELFD